MDGVEDRRLGRERHVLFPLSRSMVCDGKTEAGRCACSVLVAESSRGDVAFLVCVVLPARFGLYFCLRLYLDSVLSESYHPLSQPE